MSSKRSNHIRGGTKVVSQKTSTKSTRAQTPPQSQNLPIELQQLVLNVFQVAFATTFTPDLPVLIQQIKHHLFNREFNEAFAQEDYLHAYAVRWSPSRALAYTPIFSSLPWHTLSKSRIHLESFEERPARHTAYVENPSKDPSGSLPSPETQDQEDFKIRIVCVGGGAGAELVALGSFLHLTALSHGPNDNNAESATVLGHSSSRRFEIHVIDIADWASTLQKLHTCMTVPPPLSKYASPEAKAANTPLVSSGAFTLEFAKLDVLNMKVAKSTALFSNAALVTFMFTLNELYATSMSATTNLLLSLTILLKPSALLLVVDSPGSYSTVPLGKPSAPKDHGMRKKYPMQWLLDHTLLESSAIGSSKDASGKRQWEKLDSRESEWFRLSGALRYPVGLEDMRHQLHLYRRI